MALLMELEVTTKSAKETQLFAKKLATEIIGSNPERTGALVIALEGDLGGGKTTFSQGFALGLGVKKSVLSPTFVLLKSYKLQATSLNFRKSDFRKFIHIDAYRFDRAEEILPLGWKDFTKDTHAIILVEWADRIRKYLPKNCIKITFEFVDEKTRRIYVNYESGIK